ncbi:hypothetical protein Mal4_45780 [Maioricimonas rarisocia]|uniref:Uncharacterized protein n=1 Tax=Maioricimonas rarisocia TaxID=2528026 RepID=A0A517ZCP2_9PLAN|nr:hypothetical protein [Maioricimonas rarisocia]QDU40222.1 hypothetical protein Mal4_45780 [Maioricimonas rarisocia]
MDFLNSEQWLLPLKLTPLHPVSSITDNGVLMKTYRMALWRSLAVVSTALLVTMGTAGCRSAPVAMPTLPQFRPQGEGRAENQTVASTATSPDAPHLSLETATPANAATNGKSAAARPARAPKVSRPLPAKPAAVVAQKPADEPLEDAWDVVELETPADDSGNGWTTAGVPAEQGESTDRIQLTGHETAPALAPPRLVAPENSSRVPVPATRQVSATMAAPGGRSPCDDCVPMLNDWQQQLQEQTDTLSTKVDLLEDELKASREALQTVNTALEASNRELSRLSNDVRYWQGEVKRIETVMERQHQQDIKSLDALSTTLEQLIRDDYQSSQSPATDQNRPR